MQIQAGIEKSELPRTNSTRNLGNPARPSGTGPDPGINYSIFGTQKQPANMPPGNKSLPPLKQDVAPRMTGAAIPTASTLPSNQYLGQHSKPEFVSGSAQKIEKPINAAFGPVNTSIAPTPRNDQMQMNRESNYQTSGFKQMHQNPSSVHDIGASQMPKPGTPSSNNQVNINNRMMQQGGQQQVVRHYEEGNMLSPCPPGQMQGQNPGGHPNLAHVHVFNLDNRHGSHSVHQPQQPQFQNRPMPPQNAPQQYPSHQGSYTTRAPETPNHFGFLNPNVQPPRPSQQFQVHSGELDIRQKSRTKVDNNPLMVPMMNSKANSQSRPAMNQAPPQYLQGGQQGHFHNPNYSMQPNQMSHPSNSNMNQFPQQLPPQMQQQRPNMPPQQPLQQMPRPAVNQPRQTNGGNQFKIFGSH